MTILDSILKSRNITLPTKVRIVKDMVFPIVTYGHENWTRELDRRIGAFELWCWRRLLRVPCTVMSSNQSILKEINSWPLNQWCHPTISFSVAPFSSCPPSFPALESFPMSWLSASGGQSIVASASVLPMNTQGWFPLGLTGLICLLSKGLLRVFSSNTVWKHQFFGIQPSLWSNSHIYTCLLGKP